MKKILLFSVIIGIWPFMLSCKHSGKSVSQIAKEERCVEESDTEYTKTFPEYGFSITAPCKLEDVSAHSKGNFLVNLGGFTDGNDVTKMAAYQFIVTRLPVGYKNLSKSELSNKVDDMLRQQVANFNNVEPIKVGYEGFPGYVGYTEHNGLQQKGIMFVVNNYIIAMTVMTNSDLEAKFNKFSNGFRILHGN